MILDGIKSQVPIILTTDGGVSPVWSEDGQSIFFVSGSRLMSIPIQDGNPGLSLEISELPSRLIRSGGHTEYDVYGNGEEFIFLDSGITDGGQEMEMHVITGLSELLRQRDPAREQK